MSLHIEKPVRFVWLLANTEAYLAGEERIRPLHYFLALLKAADPKLGLQLVESGLSPDEQMKLAKDGKDICHYLEITPSKARELRRSIRRKIRPKDRSISGMKFLHRAPESRQLFRVAVQRAIARGEKTLSSPCLLESLFATGMIALDSNGQLVYGGK